MILHTKFHYQNFDKYSKILMWVTQRASSIKGVHTGLAYCMSRRNPSCGTSKCMISFCCKLHDISPKAEGQNNVAAHKVAISRGKYFFPCTELLRRTVNSQLYVRRIHVLSFCSYHHLKLVESWSRVVLHAVLLTDACRIPKRNCVSPVSFTNRTWSKK